MKCRTKQRANRKLKDSGESKPWLNHEWYHDPTAYNAIRNLKKSVSCTCGQGIRETTLQTT